MRSPLAVGLVVLATATVSCGGSSTGSSEPSTAPPAATARPSLQVVALGDSETTGAGDPTGAGWVERYARLLRDRLGLDVAVTNLAEDGKTSDELLADLRADATTRDAVKRSQVVLFGIGGADLNAGDDRFAAGACRGTACYAPVLRDFARNLDASVAAVTALRGSDTTVLRAITPPNGLTGAEDVIPPFLRRDATRIGVYQARTANEAICRAMAEHGGRCVDVLEAINGPDGTEDGYAKGLLNLEDCCYPSARGQQLMARMLFDTGLAPLR